METSRLASLAITTTLVVALVGGCGGPDPRVAVLLRQSNSHLKKAAEHLGRVAEFGRKQADFDKGQTDAEGLRETLNQARKAAEASLEEVEKALAALESAGGYRSSGGTKTYIGMKVDAVEEQKKSLETGLQAIGLRIELSDDTISGVQSGEAVVQKLKRISELDDETGRHADRSAELHKKADNYYEGSNSQN